MAASILGLGMLASATGTQAGAIHDASLFTTGLPANDDGSTELVNPGFTAFINATNCTQTYVDNNGYVTFDNPQGTYTPSAIRSGAFGSISAPFFANVDTRVAGVASRELWQRDAGRVQRLRRQSHPRRGVWLAAHLQRLSDDPDGPLRYECRQLRHPVHYDTIVWESGTPRSAPPGGLCNDPTNYPNCVSALVGYWTSASSNDTLPGSLVHGALVDGGPNAMISHSLNSNILGQYNFQMRNGQSSTRPPNPPPWRCWASAWPVWLPHAAARLPELPPLQTKRRPTGRRFVWSAIRTNASSPHARA